MKPSFVAPHTRPVADGSSNHSPQQAGVSVEMLDVGAGRPQALRTAGCCSAPTCQGLSDVPRGPVTGLVAAGLQARDTYDLGWRNSDLG